MSAIISSTSSASVNLIRVRFKSNNFSLAYSQYVWNASLVNKTALFSFSARFLFGGNKSIRSDLNDFQSRCSGSQFSNHVEAVPFSTLAALATVSRPFHPNSFPKSSISRHHPEHRNRFVAGQTQAKRYRQYHVLNFPAISQVFGKVLAKPLALPWSTMRMHLHKTGFLWVNPTSDVSVGLSIKQLAL
jgi:hypothetical protein